MATNLSLLVIRTQRLEELKEFYETLGLKFVEEKHGDGPIHYSWTSPNGVVLELYPAQLGNDIGRNRLEFTTHQNLSDVLDGLDTAGGECPIINYASILNKLLPESLIVHDPEGRFVKLIWKKSDSGIW